MTAVIVRLYTKTNTQKSVEELLQAVADEVAPQMVKQDGVFRHTLFKIADDRFGTATLCAGTDAAEAGMKLVSEWQQKTGATENVRLDRVIQGERFFAFHGGGDLVKGAHGHMRIVHSAASIQEWQVAIEADLKPLYAQEPGLLRVSILKTDQPDIYAILGVFQDRRACDRLTERATAVRSRHGSALNKVAAGEPEVTESTIIATFARA